MNLKLDENMPADLVADLQAPGHDADTVPAEGTAGSEDSAMWSWALFGRCLACGAAALVIGCGASEDLSGLSSVPSVVLESEHFRVHVANGEAPCPKTADWLEHHYASLTSYLGVSLPAGLKIEVFVHADPQDLAKACFNEVEGCAVGREVHVLQAFHPHELVHAYAGMLGSPPRFFQEGLAEVLGCGLEGRTAIIDQDPRIVGILESATFAPLDGVLNHTYSTAAGFTRFLLDRYGKERYFQFYGRLAWDASRATIEREYLQTFGEALETTIEAWVTGPEQTRASMCLYVAECATETLTDAAVPLECGPTVLGNLWPSPLVAIRSLPLDRPRSLALRVRGSTGASARILGCSEVTELDDSFFVEAAGQTEIWTELPAGRYWVYADLNAPGDGQSGSIAAQLGEPNADASCPLAIEQKVAAETDLAIWRGTFAGKQDDEGVAGLADVSLGFVLPAARTVRPVVYAVDLFGSYDGDQATLCSGCSGCESGALKDFTAPLPFDGKLLQPGEPYELTLEGSPSELGYQFGLRFSTE